MSAKSKIVAQSELVSLAATVKRQHTELNQLKDQFEANKKSLAEASKGIFLEDIQKKDAEYLGNHEYHTSDGTVTVNFKIAGSAPKEINNRPAADVLREKFGAAADDLFDIESIYDVTADDSILRAQAAEHPELFQVALRPLTHAEMMQLIIQHPGFVQLSCVNPEAYARIYPEHVEARSVVSFKGGFIETLGKVEEAVRKSAKGLLKAILPNVVQTAVNCGNRSKKS